MNADPVTGRLLKADQVAERLGVSRMQAYRLLATELPSVRFGGGTVRVLEEDLESYIIEHRDRHEKSNE